MPNLARSMKAAFTIMAALIALASGPGSAAETGRRILILHSTTAESITGRPQQEGAIKALEDAGFCPGGNLRMGIHAMAAHPGKDTVETISRQISDAVSRIARFRPEIILTIGDTAFATVALPLARTPISIVFSGLRGQPETYNRFIRFMKSRRHPGHNITGVYEKRHIRHALEILSRVTDLKKVRMVHDLTPTGRVIAEQVALELQPENAMPPLSYRTEQVDLDSWEAFQQEIVTINASPEIDAFYLGALMLKDADGHAHSATDIIQYAIAHATKPAIGIDATAINHGLYGGTSVDFYAMGYQAGEKIAEILGGAEAGSLPIQDAQTVTLVFNLVRSETLGLKIPSEILLAADEVFTR
ncbi:MAG: hypothetical protein JEZ11_14795 [Desulfobacterales bacterium]|nr:hypothetical protein [Desulfobacterales bacterium]